FHYRRPQNWAFLAGDRVTQPSSHDYRDPSKRWFPGEMEQFLPMIAQAASEIWNAAAKLQQQREQRAVCEQELTEETEAENRASLCALPLLLSDFVRFCAAVSMFHA